ncbi:MAG: hypothetical protein E6J75_14660 [Deltaproteobacteria bacterium]|nr:MAG: hypothetical protein E6J75_14660 [Deltaproteobacteria bacterium]
MHEVGAAVRRDRRGDGRRCAARVPRRRRRRRDSRVVPDGRVPAVRRRPQSASDRARRTGACELRVEALDLRAVRPRRRLPDDPTPRARLRSAAAAPLAPRNRGVTPGSAARRRRSVAARNVACAGGEPLALTDCLNFGSPEKPEIAWELEQAIEGIAQAAEALAIPVVSGNVSLYNDTDGHSIPPTPVVGCVGLVPDVRFVPAAWRQDDVVLLATAPGELDLAAEAALIRYVWKAAPVLTLAHDVSDGGLEVALREAAEHSGLEADVELPGPARGGQIVLACAPEDVDRLGRKNVEQIGIVI